MMRPQHREGWSSPVRRALIAIATVSLTMFALPLALVVGISGSASARAAASTTCPTGTSGSAPFSGPVPGNFVVPAGVTCYLSGADVMGNTSVNGVLIAWNDTFEQNVSVSGLGSDFTQFNQGDLIKGNLSITGSDGAGAQNSFQNAEGVNSVVNGNFSYTGNFTALYVAGDGTSQFLQVKGNFTYANNQNLTFQGQSQLGGLKVNGNVTCDGSNVSSFGCPVGGQT